MKKYHELLNDIFSQHIFVGMHPDYQRRQDVEIQTQLIRPDVEVVFSAKDFADQIICWAENS